MRVFFSPGYPFPRCSSIDTPLFLFTRIPFPVSPAVARSLHWLADRWHSFAERLVEYPAFVLGSSDEEMFNIQQIVMAAEPLEMQVQMVRSGRLRSVLFMVQ